MAERIDFEDLDKHSLDVLSTRVSFTPDEVNSLIRAIRATESPNVNNNAQALILAIKRRTEDGGLYKLTQRSAKQLENDLNSLFTLFIPEED